jgi:hypothetical protein
MKTKFLSILLAGCMALGITRVSAQKDDVTIKDVPKAVSNSFKDAYHDVKNINWSKIGDEFEAAFDMDNKHSYAVYNSDGKLVRTEVDIVEADLPGNVTIYTKEKYKTHEIKSARKITRADGTVSYKVKIGDDVLYFDSNGNNIEKM